MWGEKAWVSPVSLRLPHSFTAFQIALAGQIDKFWCRTAVKKPLLYTTKLTVRSPRLAPMALITVAILAVTAVFLVLRVGRARKLPQGLREVPVAGNVTAMGAYPQQQLRKCAVEYGELFQVRFGRQIWIYANSPSAVKEIFDKQSQHTSSRAPSPVVSDLLSGGMR